MTGQMVYDGDAGLAVAFELANLARVGGGKPEIRTVFAADPVLVESVTDAEAEQLLGLACRSAEVVELLVGGGSQDVDDAAELVNRLLEQSPAQLHLTKQERGWALHRHRPDASLVAAWVAVVAAAFARVISEGLEPKVGRCIATQCGNYFYDLSKNQSRRFCSLACQNRVKAAAYRSRRSR